MANEAYPDLNFYIESKRIVDKLGTLLAGGRFCLLCGHRQSGKSTICHATVRLLQDKFKENPELFDGELYVVTLDAGVKTNEGSSVFWSSLCTLFRSMDNERFNFFGDGDIETFRYFF